jgi:hypothetical protein
MEKKEIDLSTEEKKKEFFDILNSFKSKTSACKYLGVHHNQYGFAYLKSLSEKVGFDLNFYSETRKVNSKICLHCGKEFIPKDKIQKFCSQSCSASYNNKRRNIENTESRRKQSESLKKYYKEHPKEAKNGFRWIDGKKTRIEPKRCPICGSIDCERRGICKHMKKFFENLVYFGFDVKCLGTNKVFEEYERIKKLLEEEYFNNHLSPSDLKEKYHYPKTFENITQLLKTMGFKTRNLSTCQTNAILVGKHILSTSEHELKMGFKQGWHTTWDGKKIFYRSGAELKYAELLDESKTPYEVEELRIEYYDTVKGCNRVAIPDFLLTDTNEIIEVKSRITFCKQNMIDKFQKYKELGYKPKLLYEGIMYNEEEMKNIKEFNFLISH